MHRVMAPRTCRICGRADPSWPWFSQGRCPMCQMYWRRHRVERPSQPPQPRPGGRPPATLRPCTHCGQLTLTPYRGRCRACYSTGAGPARSALRGCGSANGPTRRLRHGHLPRLWPRLPDAPGGAGGVLLGRLHRPRPTGRPRPRGQRGTSPAPCAVATVRSPCAWRRGCGRRFGVPGARGAAVEDGGATVRP
jgi:hypothetical protein